MDEQEIKYESEKKYGDQYRVKAVLDNGTITVKCMHHKETITLPVSAHLKSGFGGCDKCVIDRVLSARINTRTFTLEDAL